MRASPVDLGRLLWFDTITGLNDDNTCAGCHSPTPASATRSRSPSGSRTTASSAPAAPGRATSAARRWSINTAFYPTLMWNSRFRASPATRSTTAPASSSRRPRGTSLSYLPHLLTAQAFIPPTERVEVAGFRLPGRQRRHPRRGAAAPERRPRAIASCSAQVFPAVRPARRSRSTTSARAIAEFEFTLTFADAPIDRYARGELPRAHDGREARRAALLRRGRLRVVPRRVRARRTRCSATSAST